MNSLSPLTVAEIACASLAALCWLVSIVTGNCSQVDRLWSIAPPLYVGWFASQAGFRDLRLDVMALLTALWGARLTYNFARKGGYAKGSEDYRWPVLRKRFGPVLFQLFNATFIACYQNFLLFLIALPAWAAFEHRSTPFGALDAAATVGFLVFFVGETLADQQQWRFQNDKHAKREARRRHRGRVPHDGNVRLVTCSPQLLLRAGDVVDGLPLRGRRRRRLGERDHRGGRAPHAPLPRVDDLHRALVAREVPLVRRLPTHHLAPPPVATARRTTRALGVTDGVEAPLIPSLPPPAVSGTTFPQ